MPSFKRFRKAKGLNRRRVNKNDHYQIKNDVEVADLNEDGLADVVITHEVLKNDDQFIESKVVWYGLEPEVVDAFIGALDKAGFDNTIIETNKFRVVTEVWKRITQFMKHINDLAEVRIPDLDD